MAAHHSESALCGDASRTLQIVLFATLFLILPVGAVAQGVAKGDRIPEFQLSDQNGRVQTFESVRGPKGAMLVFYRSADW